MDILKTLDKETLQSFKINVANERLVSSNEAYIKVIVDENGEMKMEEGSILEYLTESQTLKSNTNVSINSSTNTDRG